MADFISGADLVARGAEGTGAATVLNNQPTIQNLARLGGRMDNLYKTQEMLKLKLAAAKQKEVKPEKQPNITPFATGGVIGETLAGAGSQLFEAVKNISRNNYDRQVSMNDHTAANQTAADAASSLAAINSAVSRYDNASKTFLAENGDFYSITPQKVQNILQQIPSLRQEELVKITDPNEQKKYVENTFNKFLQIDPVKILSNSTTYDPSTYNYGGIFNLVNKDIANRAVETKNYDGTATARDASELFRIKPPKDGKPGSVELDYNKARNVLYKYPKAVEQMQVTVGLAENDIKNNKVYTDLKTQKEKDDKVAQVRKDAENQYISKVFASGLTLDQKADFEATRIKAEAEAKGRAAGEDVPPTAVGTMTFNVNRDVDIEKPILDASGRPVTKMVNGKPVIQKEKIRTENYDYPVESVGKTVVVKDFPLSNNQPFVFLSKQSPEDLLSIKARAYSPLGAKESVAYVSGLGSKASTATRVVGGLPMFLRAVQDSEDPNKIWYPGDFVPRHMLKAKKGRGGKSVDYLEKSDYFLPTGTVASPEITTPSESGGNVTQSTMELFYPDELSQKKVFEAIAEGKKLRAGDVFSRGKK